MPRPDITTAHVFDDLENPQIPIMLTENDIDITEFADSIKILVWLAGFDE